MPRFSSGDNAITIMLSVTKLKRDDEREKTQRTSILVVNSGGKSPDNCARPLLHSDTS